MVCAGPPLRLRRRKWKVKIMDVIIRKQIRAAGLIYLALLVTAPFGLLYVPGKVMVYGDAAATAAHLRASEGLVRAGMASELIHQTIVIFLVLALYRLFRGIDEMLARQLVVLGALVSVPIMFLNVLNQVAALMLVSGQSFLTVFPPDQLDALAYFFMRLHDRGITIASIFWGLWLFPFGLLAIRSGFIPRVFGWLLLVAGTAYLASAFTTLVLPAYGGAVGQVASLLELAEVPIILWMVVRGLWRPRGTAVAAG